jgi:DNA-binding NtrC family response regulator
LSAANAREAIALLEQDEPIDILFTDINLPDGPDAIDGIELARKAVELCPDLRVIYTTGGGQTDGMTALFVEDATFLPKPYTVKQLTEAVLATAEENPRSSRLAEHERLGPGVSSGPVRGPRQRL